MTDPNYTQKRLLRNWILKPILQIRLGLYSILLAGLFAAGVFLIQYQNLADFSLLVATLTDSESEVRQMFEDYLSDTQFWMVLLVVFYFIISVLVSIIATHKLIGPTVAFEQHLKKLCDGHYQDRVQLRKGDAFEEVAAELNRLTDILRKKEHHG